MNVRVILVDKLPIFRVGLAAVLNADTNLQVVGSCQNSSDCKTLIEQHNPNIVIIDTDSGDGIKLGSDILQTYPFIKVIFLTSIQRHADVAAALDMGASAFILKTVTPRVLVDTVHQILSGETYISPDLAARLIIGAKATNVDPATQERTMRLKQLTKREREILDELSSGQTNKEIARRLDIAEKTVKHYMGRVLQKLCARNRTEAVILAQEAVATERGKQAGSLDKSSQDRAPA